MADEVNLFKYQIIIIIIIIIMAVSSYASIC